MGKTIKDRITGIIRALIGMPLFMVFLLASFVAVGELFGEFVAFGQLSVFPVIYVMAKLCRLMIFIVLSAGFLAFFLPEKLPGVTLTKTIALLAVFLFGGLAFSVINQIEVDSWEWHYYPPYIEQYETKILYETVKCDYTTDIRFSGYFDFPQSLFNKEQAVTVRETPSLTDRYRLEIHYKGGESELDIYNYEGEEHINVYLKNYDYRLSAYDRAYMYKHKINLELSRPLVIERIIIYTAYPDKINIEEIYTE